MDFRPALDDNPMRCRIWQEDCYQVVWASVTRREEHRTFYGQAHQAVSAESPGLKDAANQKNVVCVVGHFVAPFCRKKKKRRALVSVSSWWWKQLIGLKGARTGKPRNSPYIIIRRSISA